MEGSNRRATEAQSRISFNNGVDPSYSVKKSLRPSKKIEQGLGYRENIPRSKEVTIEYRRAERNSTLNLHGTQNEIEIPSFENGDQYDSLRDDHPPQKSPFNGRKVHPLGADNKVPPAFTKKQEAAAAEEEQMYVIEDEQFSELELQQIIADADKAPVFNFFLFFTTLFYHILHSLITPFLAVPLVFLLEGCSCKMNYNLTFWIASFDPLFFVTTFIASLTSTASLMLLYGMYTGDIYWLDHIDFLVFSLGRQFVICTKYGLMKTNHIKILRGVTMSQRLKTLQLVFPAGFAPIDQITESISLELNNAQINKNTEIAMLSKSGAIYDVKDYESTRDRLLDETNQLIAVHYGYEDATEKQEPRENVKEPHDRFRIVFNRKNFENKSSNPDMIKRGDQLLNEQQVDNVDLQRLFLDMYLQAKRDADVNSGLFIFVVASLFVASPYLFRLYRGQYMFDNDYQQLAEMVLILPKLILGASNLLLMFQLNKHLSIRAYLKLKFLTMIDPEQSEAYEIERDMPVFHAYDGANLQKVQTLFEVITRYQRKHYERSTTYGVFFVGVFLAQASYLLVRVLLLEQKITPELEQFTVNAFSNATIFVFVFVHAVYLGGNANDVDFQIQRTLGKMKLELYGNLMHIVKQGELYRLSESASGALKDFQRTQNERKRTSTILSMFDKRGNNVFWLRETRAGTLRDQNSGQEFEKHLFEVIDEKEFEEKRDDMVEVIDNFNDILAYQLENEQYGVLGFVFSGALAYEFVTYYIAIGGTFAQQWIGQDSTTTST